MSDIIAFLKSDMKTVKVYLQSFPDYEDYLLNRSLVEYFNPTLCFSVNKTLLTEELNEADELLTNIETRPEEFPDEMLNEIKKLLAIIEERRKTIENYLEK